MADDEDSEWQVVTRRDFIRAGVGLGATLATGCPPTPGPKTGPDAVTLVGDEPVAPMPEGPAKRRFSGDDPRCHELLWDKQKALRQRGGLPADAASAERVRVCIIGGGLAGLSTAWLLKDVRPLVLEAGRRLGGAAQGQRWGDLDYGIGSAYITNAEPNDPHIRMLKELGLQWRVDDPTHDHMYIGGKIYPEFWFGGTDPQRAADFRAAWNYFKRVREQAFPDVPFDPKGQLSREQYRVLDERTFTAELQRELGARLHPHVEDVVRQYCWSSFCADPSEISAAAGLNFLASDLGGMYVFAGGNSGITQALVLALRRELGARAIRSSCPALDVRRADGGVRVTYLDSSGKLRTVLCDCCIVSTPKFIARKLIDDLPRAQVEAMAKLSYRAYLVASVLVDEPRRADFHDLYCIAGKAPPGSARDEVPRRPFTDVIHASFTRHGHPRRTVLNLYRGLAYDGSPQDLYAAESYDHYRALIEPALPPVLRALGLEPKRVRDVRLTRWGHALVIPRPGFLSNGVTAAAAAPHQQRILFAQQDNHAMPAFESSFAAATDARDRVRRLI